MPKTSLSLESLPPELFLSILPHLPRKDLLNLSATSKTYRAWSIPTVFQTVNILPETIAAFQSGGYLNEFSTKVQHLILDVSNIGQSKDLFEFFCTCILETPLETIFPNATAFTACFEFILYFYDEVFFGAERRLANTIMAACTWLPFYQRLKNVTIKARDSKIRDLCDEVVWDIQVCINLWCEVEKRFNLTGIKGGPNGLVCHRQLLLSTNVEELNYFAEQREREWHMQEPTFRRMSDARKAMYIADLYVSRDEAVKIRCTRTTSDAPELVDSDFDDEPDYDCDLETGYI